MLIITKERRGKYLTFAESRVRFPYLDNLWVQARRSRIDGYSHFLILPRREGEPCRCTSRSDL